MIAQMIHHLRPERNLVACDSQINCLQEYNLIISSGAQQTVLYVGIINHNHPTKVLRCLFSILQQDIF